VGCTVREKGKKETEKMEWASRAEPTGSWEISPKPVLNMEILFYFTNLFQIANQFEFKLSLYFEQLLRAK
jgi:hypothetical protein